MLSSSYTGANPQAPTQGVGGNVVNSWSATSQSGAAGIAGGQVFGNSLTGASTLWGCAASGSNARGNGAGGSSGALATPSSAAASGWNGAPGIVFVEEYA